MVVQSFKERAKRLILYLISVIAKPLLLTMGKKVALKINMAAMLKMSSLMSQLAQLFSKKKIMCF